jgi:16S rRNA (cytosine967-C5)-methyltransferase
MMKPMPTTNTGKGAATKATVSPARRAAFEILRRVEEGAYASVLLATDADNLKPNDRSLCHELVMGVLRQQLWLDNLIAHYAKRDPQRLDLQVRLALRLGLYQLRFLSRVPASAAVNESVNLVRLARLRSAEPFVNAVLRRATREPEYDPVDEISDPIAKLAVETSHPQWLIERWVDTFSFDEAQALARANNQVPPVAFRIVGQSDDDSDIAHDSDIDSDIYSGIHSGIHSGIIAALRSAGATVAASEIAPGAWRISGAASLMQQLARDGRIYVQDEASQLVAHVLDPQPGDRVLDVCAAPGSKTTHIADLIRSKSPSAASLLVAGDLHDHRLRTIVASAAAQHLDGIHCIALDGLQALPFSESAFDRVLVDAPCTGTGTLRRNPEIRWRISPGDIEDLADRQVRILLSAAQMVKPGGRLVYSTCSVEPEENEGVIGTFRETTRDFEQLVLPVRPSLISSSGAARVWPHREGADGFFIAAFQRYSPNLGFS